MRRLVAARLPGLEFCFCVGDDRTDEDMFKSLSKSDIDEKGNRLFTCTIGSATKMTRADYHVSDPKDLIDLLHHLAFDN